MKSNTSKISLLCKVSICLLVHPVFLSFGINYLRSASYCALMFLASNSLRIRYDIEKCIRFTFLSHCHSRLLGNVFGAHP